MSDILVRDNDLIPSVFSTKLYQKASLFFIADLGKLIIMNNDINNYFALVLSDLLFQYPLTALLG